MKTLNCSDFSWHSDKKWLVAEASDLRMQGYPREIVILGNKSAPKFVMSDQVRDNEELLVCIYTSSQVPGVEVHILND